MKLYPSIPPNLAEWAVRQPLFLTASAPTHAAHVNVSPKGLAAHIAFLGPNLVAYIDRTGSGCETIAHSYENGRLTLMFMSFGTIPRILRLFCRSRVIETDAPDFDDWLRRVAGETGRTKEDLDGARAVIVCDVWEVQTSCGYGVPVVKKGIYAPGDDAPTLIEDDSGKTADELSVFEDRRTLDENWRRRAVNGTIEEYQAGNNAESLDGLPGLRTARRTAGQYLFLADLKARVRRAAAEVDGIALGVAVSLFSLGVYHGAIAFLRKGRF
jgi:hypothetical protein